MVIGGDPQEAELARGDLERDANKCYHRYIG